MKNKKGESMAMEFLMTYGWAILASIIAIGVLAYFGVFTPGKYIPEEPIDYHNNWKIFCEQYDQTYERDDGQDYCVKIIDDNAIKRKIIEVSGRWYFDSELHEGECHHES